MTERERDQMLLRIEEQNRMILAALERAGLLAAPRSNQAQEVSDAQKLAAIFREHGPKAYKNAQRAGLRRAR